MRLILAFLIGVLFALADVAFAHDHPAPTTCVERCADWACDCEKKYRDDDHECLSVCTDRKWACIEKCDGTGTVRRRRP